MGGTSAHQNPATYTLYKCFTIIFFVLVSRILIVSVGSSLNRPSPTLLTLTRGVVSRQERMGTFIDWLFKNSKISSRIPRLMVGNGSTCTTALSYSKGFQSTLLLTVIPVSKFFCTGYGVECLTVRFRNPYFSLHF